jgi:hypothetical protein
MNQYSSQRKLPALLRGPVQESSIKSLNVDLMEVVVNGQRAVVPTAEAYSKLVAKVARLEQKVVNIENKAGQALRKAYE